MRYFRWGILGTGFAARKFVFGLRSARGARPVLVASRNRANAERFASDFEIPEVADSYAAAAVARDVDAFYIATPPSEHGEHAMLCIDAGKPVLIEKPLAPDARTAREIIAAARERSVFCMEGMWTRFIPLVRHLVTIIETGDIGEPRFMSGSFGAAGRRTPADSMFDKSLGGGALLHRGVYPLSLACHLMGPHRAVASQAILGTTGIDEDTTVSVRHAPAGLSLSFCSLRIPSPNDFHVMGAEGTVHVLPPIYRPFRMLITRTPESPTTEAANRWVEALNESRLLHSAQQRLTGLAILTRRLVRGTRTKVVTMPYRGNGYHYEAEELMRCVRAGKVESNIMPHDHTLRTLETMDEARKQWEWSSG